MKKIIHIFLLLGACQISLAQIDFNKTPNDDLGNVSDEYQELFFESLKQKAIENYDRAVESLLACEKLDNSDPALYFELGKNYKLLKNYNAAETALQKAITLQPDNEWFLDELYTIYDEQDLTNKAIETVKKLVKHHPDYKEDLAALYLKAKKYDEALQILDNLDRDYGVSQTRDYMRNVIYARTGRKQEQIINLQNRIKQNPKQEKNYLSLIYHYSENNQTEKAYQTAQKLLETNPNSQLVHLALYKFYLEKNKPKQAIASMKIVMQSNQIEPNAKTSVLNDFVQFVKQNPQYEKDLVEITSNTIKNTNDTKTNQELAQYYLAKNDKTKALQYFEKALNQEPDNYSLLKNTLLLYLDLQNYQTAQTKSVTALDNYPSQPLLYLINGVANNKLNNPQKAIEILELGMDYIIDDTKMQADFYKQLAISHTQLNNTTQAKSFTDKAKQLEP